MAESEGFTGFAGFAGFAPEGVAFYRDLRADNRKEFWAERKGDYECYVRQPMEALVDALQGEFGPGTIFRPYRDVRFSKDKSPYKTHQGAIAGPAPGVGYYVQLDDSGLTMGGGFHTHSPAQTARYRDAVSADTSGPALQSIVAALETSGYDIEGAALKTRPRGVDPDHPRLNLLRRKEIMAVRRVGQPEWLGSPAALEAVRAAWQDIRPLAEWVMAHVGAAEAEQARRRR